MKKLLLVLSFLFVSLLARAQIVETLDFGPRGKLTLYLLGEWKVDSTNFARQGSMTISPTKESVNASCTLTVSFPEADRLETKARLKLKVEADAYNLAEGSVERKAVAREFNLSSGAMGFYCSFTDPDLRGQPSQKGNYKVTSIGKIKLAPDVLVDVQILADGFRDEAYQQLLGAIEGMEFRPGSGR